MKFKAITIFLLIAVLSQTKAQEAKLSTQKLQKAFIEKSIAQLELNLSENFSIGAYTNKAAKRLLQGLTEKYPCDSITYLKETAISSYHKVDILVHRTGKSPLSSALYTDLAGKILYVDLFDQLYGMNRYQPSKLRAKIPFELIDNSIVLTLKLNNSPRPLKFLFDTGADGMAINESLADSIGLKDLRKQSTSVVGGNMQISVSQNNDVHLDTLILKNQGIALFKEVHKGTDGLIGNNMTKQFITKVDFDKKELLLYDFGTYTYEPIGKTIPITIPEGLFIVPGVVSITPNAVNAANLVFDTGAAYNLICFRPFVKKHKLLVSGFKSTYHGTTTSMGMTTPTYSGKAHSFSFANMPALNNLDVTLMAGGGQSESWNPGFDGSIGIKLISRYNFTINLQNKEIHLSPNANFNKPFDFVLGGYLLDFNDKNELVVDKMVTASENQPLTPGTIITGINDIASSIWLKDNKKLQQLQNSPSGTSFKITYLQNGKKLTTTIK
jgi:hypothetical protein